MACRSIELAKKAKDEILKINPKSENNIDIMQCDVSDFKSIDTFVKEIEKKY